MTPKFLLNFSVPLRSNRLARTNSAQNELILSAEAVEIHYTPTVRPVKQRMQPCRSISTALFVPFNEAEERLRQTDARCANEDFRIPQQLQCKFHVSNFIYALFSSWIMKKLFLLVLFSPWLPAAAYAQATALPSTAATTTARIAPAPETPAASPNAIKVRAEVNSATGRLTVKTDNVGPTRIELTDVGGRPVLTYTMMNGLTPAVLNVSGLPAGAYIVHCAAHEKSGLRRVKIGL